MIRESSYWKTDLLKRADALERRRTQRRWTDASHARVEQDLMLGFYAVRKLIEAHKLSDNVASQRVSVLVHPALGKPVTKLNWHRLDELFDLDGAKEENRELLFACNQFIHSYIFSVGTAECGGLDSFFVASDRQRNSGLFQISLSEVLRIFREVGVDDPTRLHMRWDECSNDYHVNLETETDR